MMQANEQGHAPKSMPALMVAAIGVVFGDIGTSPLYAMKECFAGPHRLALDAAHVYGVLSLMFWSVMAVVSLKYVSFMMRADNRGEGGSLALLALVTKISQGKRWSWLVAILGIFAAALFYGDSMITPAISVLSAVEGLQVVAPGMVNWVEPVTLGILVSLFLIQRKGSAAVGTLFGPVMCLWFAMLALLGVVNIAAHPHIFQALDPRYAVAFFALDPWIAFLALGSVVLVMTGAEALYTDMGHFGKRPIRYAWFLLILPGLMLNYFGQGALLLSRPDAIENPFFLMTPEWGLWPMLLLATMATVIASQAVITGAFSVTQQAIQLGYLPRMTILHTSASTRGQIYIPFINWMLLIAVAALVIGFDSSSNLASAYGVAVTGTMLIDSVLIVIVMLTLWHWSRWLVLPLALFMLCVDLAFFSANATKILHGGWFPLVVALIIFTLLTTWKRGRALMFQSLRDEMMPLDTFISVSANVPRVSGTAVFMTSDGQGVPHAMLHNLKHNKVLHERVVVMTIVTDDIPHVASKQSIEVQDLGGQFYRILVHTGFMQSPNVPRVLERCAALGLSFDMMDTSFFLNRETLIASKLPGMAIWRERLFAWMSRNATSPMEFFRIPANRVVELGCQVEI